MMVDFRAEHAHICACCFGMLVEGSMWEMLAREGPNGWKLSFSGLIENMWGA